MRAWLAGDYREEPRFPLRQSCDGYAAYSCRLPEVDGEIEEYAAQLKAEMELRGRPAATREDLGRTAAPGEQEAAGSRSVWRDPDSRRQRGGQAQELPGEVGPTPKMVRRCGRFCGLIWGLCLNHEISRGKVLSCNTPKVKHPAATASAWRHNPCKRARVGATVG